jgi:hypothetical protein
VEDKLRTKKIKKIINYTLSQVEDVAAPGNRVMAAVPTGLTACHNLLSTFSLP